MNEIRKDGLTRRDLLKIPFAVGASFIGSTVLGNWEGLTRIANADGLPEKWPSTITRIAPTQEIRDQEGRIARLKKGEMMVITSRGVNVLGNSVQVVENDPSAVAVTVVAASENVDVPFSTSRKDIYAWVDLIKTSKDDFPGIMEEAIIAGEVKVSETKKFGQCGLDTGCGSTRLVVAIAHKDPLNSSLIKYDSVRDRFYPEQQSPCDKIVVVGAVCQPCVVAPVQPEAAPQVPEFPKNILEASAIFGGRPENWQQNADGGWLLSPLPNNQIVLVNPNKHMMEGTTVNGIFVCGGTSIIPDVLGAPIWNEIGSQEAVNKLYREVTQNNPGKQVTLIP